MTLTIDTPLLVFIIVEVAALVFAATRDNTDKWLGSDRDWALFLWVIFTLLATALFGGIYWW